MSASQHATSSWRVGPLPPRPLAHTRPSKATGVERAVKSARQMRFSPARDQEVTRPVSSDTPLRLGPRQFGQSPAEDTPGAMQSARSAVSFRLIFI